MDDRAASASLGALFEREGRPRRFGPGERLVMHGSPPSDVLWITDGLVKVSVAALSGRESVLEVRGRGNLVGELSVVLDRHRGADAIAVGEVGALSIPATTFASVLTDDATIGSAVLHVVASRLAEASAHQHRLATSDAIGRLCGVLSDLADRLGRPIEGGVELSGQFSQQDLADFAGVSRDAVVRSLTTLRQAGALETGRQSIVIRDPDAIERLAGA